MFSQYYESSVKNNCASMSPAIMESIDNPSLLASNSLTPSDTNISDLVTKLSCSKLRIDSFSPGSKRENEFYKSFLLIDEDEKLRFTKIDEFLKCLKCDQNDKVKVVSIFGNTGDGKSFTLNECFFNGREIFNTSNDQDSCTIGIWVAYDKNLNIVCIDTEGLLGSSPNENQRTRLLLKVLAISDIVIYRTRSERLHRDLFTFLGTASRAYSHHFSSALASVGQKAYISGALSSLGPAVIIFHETRHTNVLNTSKSQSAEDYLRKRFAEMRLDIDAFSSLRYIGIQTIVPPTNFKDLRNAVIQELRNTTVRSSRSAKIVFITLKALNDKFSGNIESTNSDVMFPDQYFTCPARCLSCESRCSVSMGHFKEGSPHISSHRCKYEKQYNNLIYVCKQCYTHGKESIVTPKYSSYEESAWFAIAKYAWSGYVIECPQHGQIYRSRQFWYGNADPEMRAVRSEIRHVWPDDANAYNNLQNPGQRVIDGVSYFTEAVYNASSEQSRALSSWVADQVAPKYWELNSEIKNCSVCKRIFDSDVTKHHCRACGKGVCNSCSTHNRPVPERGWSYPVRVCDTCMGDTVSVDRMSISSDVSSDDTEVRVRKVTEAVVNTISSVACVLDYPKSVIKDSARPSYWVPDEAIQNCCICKISFKDADSITLKKIHHCRDCGEGVCSKCSHSRRSVIHRGWVQPVRVCDNCAK